jgi:peptidoglycan/LPS O-acetylase OafA/YrhL
MPSGFIGVDIFFVISGYLITGVLMREMQLNNFTFFSFCGRCARRTFPAFFAVLFFTLIGSYSLFLPSDLFYALKGTTGILFFILNVVFWEDSAAGYFAAMNSAQITGYYSFVFL